MDADGSHMRPVADIFAGSESSWPSLIARTSDALYFAANDGIHGLELWRLAAVTDAILRDAFD